MASDDPTRGSPRSNARPAALEGRYTAVREIGRGGMGSVHEATDPVLGRVVAVKQALTDDPQAMQRFGREIRITARLEHPSIVPIYDAGQTRDGVPFYVMRRLSGRPLETLIEDRAELDDRLALLPTVLAAVQAVAHAHQRGVIHRDLKPANIIVGELGETTVIDWGLARTIDDPDPRSPDAATSSERWVRTRAGAVMGTPGYMAPEQRQTSDVDKRADVYSLGATLHHVLAGGLPSACPLPSGVPVALGAIVAKAIALAPADRYADAGELADELQRFLTGRLVAAHRYTWQERGARFARRHRGALVVATAALAILAIGSWLAVDRIVVARDTAVHERDVANQQRMLANDRAGKLLLEQARLLIATDPTRAAAMARTLAESSQWRTSRAIISAARMAGVPWRFGARAPRWLGMASSGRHAVIVDADGTHVLDLRDHTRQTWPDLGAKRFALCERLVAADGTRLSTLELATGARVQLALGHPVAALGCSDGVVFGVSVTGVAWYLRTTDRAPTELAIPERASRIVASPDGARFVVAGATQLWLVEAGRVDKLAAGTATDLAFAPDGHALVAVIGDRVVTASWPGGVTSHDGLGTLRVTTVGKVVYQAGMAGLGYRADLGDRWVTRALASRTHPWPLHHARDTLVVTWTGATLEILDVTSTSAAPVQLVRVASPLGPIEQVATTPRGPFVAAIAAGSVLVWNLDDVIARRSPYPASGTVRVAPIAGHAALAQGSGDVAVRIDLATRHTTQMAPRGVVRVDSVGPTTIAIDSQRQLWQVHDDGAPTLISRGPVAVARLADRATVALATMAGALEVIDLATRQARQVLTLPQPPDALAAVPGWIVVRTAHELRRIETATGASTTVDRVSAFGEVAPDGSVLFARVGEVVRWGTDQRVIARIPEPIDAIIQLAADRAWVAGDHVYEVSTAGASPVAATAPLRSIRTVDGQVVTFVDDGHPTVLDADTGVRWRAQGAPATAAGSEVSGDGTSLFAVIEDQLWVWQIGRPATAADTARWADAATNARWDAVTSSVVWR